MKQIEMATEGKEKGREGTAAEAGLDPPAQT